MNVACPRCKAPPYVMCLTPSGRARHDHVARVKADAKRECCDLCVSYTDDTVSIDVGHGRPRAVCWTCRGKLRTAGET